MKLKNVLLGACFVMAGAAFGQQAKIYIPDEGVMLYTSACQISEDDDGNTVFDIEVVDSVTGEEPDYDDPASIPYLGRPGGFVGPGGWWSRFLCRNGGEQCVWTIWYQ